MFKLKLVASLSAALIATTLMAGQASAACRHSVFCPPQHHVAKHRVAKHHVTKHHVRLASSRTFSRKRQHTTMALAALAPKGRGNVVAMIKAQAPRYGVPTWFALRIAQIESGYNPRARGAAGEYGVFQLKCATARGIGFRGPCGNLLNASTNIQFGLKHLSLAVRGSHGNLRLAASKHNGGLGYKRIVKSYVSRVF